MIKSWNFFNNDLNQFLIAGRQLQDYAKDCRGHFENLETTSINSKFDNLRININSGLIGFNLKLLQNILEIAEELPVSCMFNGKIVLYISDAKEELTANIPTKNLINLDNLDHQLQLVNDSESLSEFNKRIQLKLYNDAIAKGIYIMDKQSVYFAYDTDFGKNIIIEPNVYIGSGVIIEDNVTIKSFSYLEGVRIRNNTTIGPFARIRPTSEIGPNAKIGNFVEIKNSALGAGSKAGHLSYLGDSEIGSNVNIGAGVVTCNYDGKEKHKTQIKNNSFIGTNSSIIAPITIGNNTLIGAGSFINQNVPDNHFAIGRAKQENKLNKRKLDNN